MNRARVLYQMARADFLERVRRYSFLITVAFAVYLGYAVYAGQIMLRLGDYRGVYNSAWLGSVMSLIGSVFLSLTGFYVVKNSVQRDRDTRVGQVLAATPMSRPAYTFSKAISNFAVLLAMLLVIALAALLMQFLRAEDPRIDLWALLAPVLLLAVPALAFTASLAILFETLPFLRGGAGNVIYFFLWIALLALGGMASLDQPGARVHAQHFTDFSGIATMLGQMQTAVRSVDPSYTDGASFGAGMAPPTKRFLWSGVDWDGPLVLSRFIWLILSAGVALIASLFFHRFDPARSRGADDRFLSSAHVPETGEQTTQTDGPPRPAVHLTPLGRANTKSRFIPLVASELRLMLKGRRWWWYAVAAALFIASAASPLAITRGGIILAAWMLPVLLWSQMGAREARHATQSLIFCSEKVLFRQLPAVWTAGVLVAIAAGGGLAIRLALSGDLNGLAAWVAGALFIPALALALGTWSGSSKPFEALYTAWWYIGPGSHIPGLDFMGTTPASSRPLTYFLLTAILLTAAFAGRRSKLAYA